MKRLFFILVIVGISALFPNFSYSYIVTQLGPGWVCIENCNIQGKVVGGIIKINGDLETSTKATVECSGQGFCARVTANGYIEVDLLPEMTTIIVPNQQPPNPLESDQMLFEKK
jgi:hypothetical protein